MKTLYHIAKTEDWEQAKKNGVYEVSTLGKGLEEIGFIHLSFKSQVKMVADFIYKGMGNLVLLKINPEKLTAEVKVEEIEGSDEKFPHLYGALNLSAVEEIIEFMPQKDGTFLPVSD